MKTAREAVTEDFWRKSRALLLVGDPFAKDALILLAQSYKPSIEPIANAATRTLLAHSMRNPQ
jgi:hypothetical protein